jgi:hypothetical protein
VAIRSRTLWLSVFSGNDADQDFARQRVVMDEKCRYSFQCDKQEVSVCNVTPALLETGDLFFLPFKALVIFGDVTFEYGGKFDVFLNLNYLLYEQPKQSMPLGRVDGGIKLLLKFNNVLLSDRHKPLRDHPFEIKRARGRSITYVITSFGWLDASSSPTIPLTHGISALEGSYQIILLIRLGQISHCSSI